MSYTTVHKVPESGEITEGFEIQNAWFGAMYVWEKLYWQYLHLGAKDEFSFGMMMGRDLDKPNSLKMVWDLYKQPKRIAEDDRIVLGTTFDKAMVKRENLPRLIEAFEGFIRRYGTNPNLDKQVIAYETLAKDETCYAVCWTQTSVAGDAWLVYEKDKDDHRGYDISRDTGHWFLFDETGMN